MALLHAGVVGGANTVVAQGDEGESLGVGTDRDAVGGFRSIRRLGQGVREYGGCGGSAHQGERRCEPQRGAQPHVDFLVLVAFGHGPDFPGEGAYHRAVARNVSGLGDWRKGMARRAIRMIEAAVGGYGAGERNSELANGLRRGVREKYALPSVSVDEFEAGERNSELVYRLSSWAQ